MLKWCTDLLHLSAKNISQQVLKDRKGTATIIFGLLFLIPFMVFSFFLIESRYFYILKKSADDAVVGAALASLSNADPVEMAYGEIVLEPEETRNTFDDIFCKNMKLDESFNPLTGSIAANAVTVEEFEVYNPEDCPTVCPRGTPIQNTAIHVVISFKAERPALKGLFGEYVDITIHRDVDYFCELN